MTRLRGDWNRACAFKGEREPRENAEVGVQLDPPKTTNAERRKAVIVLQPAELSFDGGASTIEPLPLVRPVRDRAERNRAALSQTDDGDAAALACLVHDPVVVVSLVHRARLGPNAARVGGVEERGDEQGLVAAGRLNAPRHGKIGARADGGVDLLPVEAPRRPRRDCGAVAPGGVRVGVAFALRATRVDVPLTVRESGHVARVDGNVDPVLGERVAERDGHGVEAVRERGLIGTQLDREAVAGPTGRGAAERGLQAGMLGDERRDARPGGEREQGLDEASAYERTGTEALAATTLRGERVDERRYFGGVEECRNVANSRATRYLARCHWRSLSIGHAPGSANCAGALLFEFAGRIIADASDGACDG